MRFDHRPPIADAHVFDRVWTTRSDSADTMTSVARTSVHLIIARSRGVVTAGLRGPETKASTAPVPAETEFLGVRFTSGARFRSLPVSSMVDGYVPLVVTDGGRIVIGGEEREAPTFENVEDFVRKLVGAGTLLPAPRDDDHLRLQDVTTRTRERRYRALAGMPRTAAMQIERANTAALMLSQGHHWLGVVTELGYSDQPHLAHALRRFVGRTASEIRSDGVSGLSFLYKTDAEQRVSV